MTTPAEPAGPPGLFEVAELVPLRNARRAEAGLMRALRAAEDDKLIRPADAGMIAGALVAARALDRAEALPDKSSVYAVAQLLPPFQKLLHGLGLPLEPAPVGGSRLPDAAGSGDGAPSWLGDEFGTPSAG